MLRLNSRVWLNPTSENAAVWWPQMEFPARRTPQGRANPLNRSMLGFTEEANRTEGSAQRDPKPSVTSDATPTHASAFQRGLNRPTLAHSRRPDLGRQPTSLMS